MRESLLVVAHPDDIEMMMGFAAEQSEESWALIATNGEASTVDLIGRGFCPGRKAA